MDLKALGLALALLATPANADFDAEAFPPYERCALCHGLFGTSAIARFPHLGGQDPIYIRHQIEAFLEGSRHNDGGQMASIVSELKPEEIPIVVAWFSQQDPPAPSGDGNAVGQTHFVARGCDACHDAEVSYLGVPHLASQHAGYLIKQMQDFRDGRRETHDGCLPHASLMPDTDDEIHAIANYLAAQRRP
ncbi:c-type cytochrome [Shimia sp. NS0008-38b]|uniref:c-type cytochrome n=1 Tax=Shimia sp. NS0008-38b TaxID=3127653 RepID=UPI003101D721